jgi:hypothetical protein
MARPRIYKKPARVHLTLQDDIKKAAAKYAFQLGLTGGLTELVSKLLVTELTKKTIAETYARNLEVAK